MNSRKDAKLTTTQAMPAAAANNSHAGIDLEQTTADLLQGKVEVLLTVPALPSLADGVAATFTFQDSADNSTFAAIAELATLTRTGAGGAGSAATTRRVTLPATTRRYIRVNQAVATSGGNNTAVSTTVEVLT